MKKTIKLFDTDFDTESAVNTEHAIIQGLAALEVDTPAAVKRLAAYVALLQRWNRVYNLTAVRDTEDVIVRHILDSLAILPWLRGPRVLDVGSGAGLPGIPLALVRPNIQFYLLDSNAKRTRFMQQAIIELAIANATVLRSRVEDYRASVEFDSVVSRAFATVPDMLRYAGHHCALGGRLLAMKGTYPDQELERLPTEFRIMGVYPLTIPGLEAARHLIHLGRVSNVENANNRIAPVEDNNSFSQIEF